MGNVTGSWVHPPGGQSITALSSAKTEISLGGYYTRESSHHNCYINGVNATHYCPWCPRTTATIDHLFFDCPSITAFWNSLAKILHELLGPQPLQKKRILYCYSTLDITPQYLADCLLVLAKPTVPSNEQHPPPNARLPAHIPHEAAIPSVHRDAVQYYMLLG
jgi:hypothetical protein